VDGPNSFKQSGPIITQEYIDETDIFKAATEMFNSKKSIGEKVRLCEQQMDAWNILYLRNFDAYESQSDTGT
jgi:hypothetical protein